MGWCAQSCNACDRVTTSVSGSLNRQVKDKAALAIFDDSNIGKEGERFKQMLDDKKQIWWETSDKLLWSQVVNPIPGQSKPPPAESKGKGKHRETRETAALSQLDPLGRLKSGAKSQMRALTKWAQISSLW